jgi:asparagine synthase (glutamine-hydrolysing)
MCGICGTTRAVDGQSIAAMNSAMRHRGPDDEGIHLDRLNDVGLGVRRLSVIDVAGGHQPVSNEDGTVWAILNGEIYNHPMLRERLRGHGHRFSSRSDTEVLVHGFEEFGDELVHALEGMFAFAIWDGRRRRLLLARDRFGEKPLFYSHHGGVLTFASELTALRSGAGLTRELSAQAIDAFFVFGYIPGPGTILQDVRQLPPGHILTWEHSTGAVAIRRYWAPLPMPAGPRLPFGELVEETHQLLEASVKARMISDVPLGVFLSGGVDSTLVAALAVRSSVAPVKTFTVGYDVGGVNETNPARRVAEALGTNHHEIILTLDDVSARAPSVLAALDQPIADQALVASHALAEGARRAVTVAVGGEGADELFGGYPRYQWLARSLLLHQLMPGPALKGASAALDRIPLSGRTRRLRDIFSAGPSIGRHFEWVTDRRVSLRRRLYGPQLQPRMVKRQSWLDMMNPTTPGLDGDVAGIMRLDQTMWLPDDVLAKADRASMLVSLEVRTPYLDRCLAEFAATIPAAVHCSGQGKALLRATLGKVMPMMPSTQPKTAFRVPSAEWLRGPLAASLSNQLRTGRLYRDGWFDRNAVDRLTQEHQNRTRDWSSVLWPILALGLWMDRFLGES